MGAGHDGKMMDFAGELHEELSGIRRDLHQHPELLYDVFRTSKLVTDLLESWGIEVRRNVGRHFGMGVVGTLHGTAGSGPTLLLRADMDALPIREENDVSYRSKHEGVMHACGHDAHTAMLLGAARTLAHYRHRVRGTIRFVFQPAEEGALPSPLDGRLLSGGRDMIEDGVLEHADQCYAHHGCRSCLSVRLACIPVMPWRHQAILEYISMESRGITVPLIWLRMPSKWQPGT
ncbi:M20 family metallopeptidase [Paenibacillus sp. MDMC362]|uniref:M20 metallopeptidase family protein n=1 Tax=Paenibacillus sp. MDMC362 TaxID=2977365 RepID=UPI00215E4B6F|nr:amidohydrolase [Paenibacillus sp. MDMC362]